MNKKLQEAHRILDSMSDFSIYMLAMPTRGPLRNTELTREQLIEQFAKSHTLAQLQAWR